MESSDGEDSMWKLLQELSISTDSPYSSPQPSPSSSLSSRSSSSSSIDIPCCQHCNSENIILDSGNYVCYGCNTILERFIDMTAEWRYYGADDNKSSDPTRCGMPVNDLLPDSSLGSVISNQYNESYDMKLIKKYHMWNSISYKERSLYNIFENISVNAINNGISGSIIEEAKSFYKKVSESRISRGENRSGLIATSIYMSCKSNNVPRSTKEIAKIFNLKATTMTRGCKKFNDIMQINMESSHPLDFIQRFCSKLNLPNNMRTVCRIIVERADELNLVCESTPPSVSSGAIYLCNIVYNLGISKKDLSDASNVSCVTLSKVYKKLEAYKHLLIPDL